MDSSGNLFGTIYGVVRQTVATATRAKRKIPDGGGVSGTMSFPSPAPALTYSVSHPKMIRRDEA
jgi:hypothetical protein